MKNYTLTRDTLFGKKGDALHFYENTLQGTMGSIVFGRVEIELLLATGIIEEVVDEKDWKPLENDIYWFVSDQGTIYESTWKNHQFDNFHYYTSNCHRTEAGAIQHRTDMLAQGRGKKD